LTLHEKSAYPKPVTEGIPFLGFVIFPDHRRVKARKGYAYRRKLHHLVKSDCAKQVQDSVQGWINHVRYGDTYGLRKSLLTEVGLFAEEDGYG